MRNNIEFLIGVPHPGIEPGTSLTLSENHTTLKMMTPPSNFKEFGKIVLLSEISIFPTVISLLLSRDAIYLNVNRVRDVGKRIERSLSFGEEYI